MPGVTKASITPEAGSGFLAGQRCVGTGSAVVQLGQRPVWGYCYERNREQGPLLGEGRAGLSLESLGPFFSSSRVCFLS